MNNESETVEIEIGVEDEIPEDGEFEPVSQSILIEKNISHNDVFSSNPKPQNLMTENKVQLNQNQIQYENLNQNQNTIGFTNQNPIAAPINNNYPNNNVSYPNNTNNVNYNNQFLNSNYNNQTSSSNNINPIVNQPPNYNNPINKNVSPNQNNLPPNYNNPINQNVSPNQNNIPSNYNNFNQNFMSQDNVYQSGYYGHINDVPSKIPNVQNTYGVFNSQYSELNNTQVFMNKAVDITCEEHREKKLGIVEATRYCCECLKIICDSCVIEYHSEHLDKAKKKIDAYFSEQKKELETLIIENKYRIEQKQYLTEIEDRKNKLSDEIKRFFSNRSATYSTLKDKIEDLNKEENELKNRILKAIEIFHKDECYTRLDYPIKQLNSSKFF